MGNRAPCAWMSGPKDASVQLSPVKWWLAVSRDMLAKSYRGQKTVGRAAVNCHLTPMFSSPLPRKRVKP